MDAWLSGDFCCVHIHDKKKEEEEMIIICGVRENNESLMNVVTDE